MTTLSAGSSQHMTNVRLLTRVFTPVSSVTLLLGGTCALALVAQWVAGMDSTPLWGIGLVVVVTGLLLTLDGLLTRRYGERPPARIALSAVIIHSLLVEAAALVNGLTYASMLYLTLPFPTFFLLGRWAGLAVSAGALGWFTLKFILLKPGWLSDPGLLNTYLLFVIALALIVAMAQVVQRERANRQRAEALLADLEASHIKLARYAEQVAEGATIAERNRLARDIHDSLGHYLTVVGVQLEKAVIVHADDPAAALDAVHSAKRVTDQALAEVRRSVGALREEAAAFHLRPALDRLLANLTALPFTVELTLMGSETGWSPPQLDALYRAVQEGLTNVHKHARARRVRITITLEAGSAALCLTDDGSGLPPDLVFGFGLRGLHERVQAVGGHLRLTPAPGGGTQLQVTLPKVRNSPP